MSNYCTSYTTKWPCGIHPSSQWLLFKNCWCQSSQAFTVPPCSDMCNVPLRTISFPFPQEVQTEPIIADALRDPRKGRQRCKNQGREGLPSAHLPIKVTIDYVKSKLIEVANSKPQFTARLELVYCNQYSFYSTMAKLCDRSLTDWLTDWWIDWLIYLLISWSTDWLADVLLFQRGS